MLFKQPFLDAIVDGKVSLAFRRWVRPSVRAGGMLKTAVGVLAIDAVIPIRESAITDAAARAAGYSAREDLLAELNKRSIGDLYRIELRLAGPDPRVALRQRSDVSPKEWEQLQARLNRLDRVSARGPWTLRVLRLIDEHPAVRAGDLAGIFGQETAPFKTNVRKLKNLGLTESLEIGYRLSPRGLAVLQSLQSG